MLLEGANIVRKKLIFLDLSRFFNVFVIQYLIFFELMVGIIKDGGEVNRGQLYGGSLAAVILATGSALGITLYQHNMTLGEFIDKFIINSK